MTATEFDHAAAIFATLSRSQHIVLLTGIFDVLRRNGSIDSQKALAMIPKPHPPPPPPPAARPGPPQPPSLSRLASRGPWTMPREDMLLPLLAACDWRSICALGQVSSEWKAGVERYCRDVSRVEARGMRFDKTPVITVLKCARLCPGLRELVVSSPEFGSRHLQHALLKCPKLRHIDLRGCMNLSDEAALYHVGVLCPRLSYLNLYNVGCSDMALIALASCLEADDPVAAPLAPTAPSRQDSRGVPMRLLYLSIGNNGVTAGGVLPLCARAPNLLALDLSWTRVEGTGVCALVRLLPCLRTLELDGVHGVNDDTVREVCKWCQRLEHLSLVAFASVESLTNAAVDHMISSEKLCRRLRRLSLASQFLIDDVGAKRLLESCTALEHFNLAGLHKVSKETAQRAAALSRMEPDRVFVW